MCFYFTVISINTITIIQNTPNEHWRSFLVTEQTFLLVLSTVQTSENSLQRFTYQVTLEHDACLSVACWARANNCSRNEIALSLCQNLYMPFFVCNLLYTCYLPARACVRACVCARKSDSEWGWVGSNTLTSSFFKTGGSEGGREGGREYYRTMSDRVQRKVRYPCRQQIHPVE